MIVIIDYGVGNLRSVEKAIVRLNYNVKISRDIKDIESATKLILPGVGHYQKGMENLNQLGLIGLLNKKVIRDKVPILGICLGMQLMTEFSEEGDIKGLGWINARTVKFKFNNEITALKVPHMGWNTINTHKKSLFDNRMIDSNTYYFVHSYYVKCNNEEDVLFTTKYGIEFHSAFLHGNICGVQFHPEKSHQSGLVFLKFFLNIDV